jgi:uncharacterized membrane protein
VARGANVRGMMPRAVIALASLVSGAVAFYLHLWKLGYAAPPGCGAGGGCALAQFSWYGWFLGVDVALIGAVGYAAIALVAIAGALPRWREARWPTVALAALVYPAVLFTLRLKYGEFVVLRTFCPWCAVSAVTITLCAVLVWLDWRRLEARRAAPGDGATGPGEVASGRSAD